MRRVASTFSHFLGGGVVSQATRSFLFPSPNVQFRAPKSEICNHFSQNPSHSPGFTNCGSTNRVRAHLPAASTPCLVTTYNDGPFNTLIRKFQNPGPEGQAYTDGRRVTRCPSGGTKPCLANSHVVTS